MTDHVKASAARATYDADETAQPTPRDRLPRTVLVERRFVRESPYGRAPVRREPAFTAHAGEPALPERAAPQAAPAPEGGEQEKQDQAQRDLARLEALLVNELRRERSPSIAADNDRAAPAMPRQPIRRRTPPPWAQLAAARSASPLNARRAPVEPDLEPTLAPDFADEPELYEAPEPAHPSPTYEVAEPQHEEPVWQEEIARRERISLAGRRALEDLDLSDEAAPFAAAPRARARSPVARAIGTAATIFSVLALVAVSTLLVALVVGDDRRAPVAQEPAPTGGTAALQERAPEAAAVELPVEESGPQVITGSVGMPRDESRIAPNEPAPSFGTVRAADTATVYPQAPAQPEAMAPVVAEPREPISPNASPFAPPNAAQASAAEQGFAPAQPEASVAAEPAPAAPETVASIAEPASAAPETRAASVTSDVNLRAGPENDANVLVVVPRGRDVQVVECSQWCEVIYQGQQGFIHRRFVNGAGG